LLNSVLSLQGHHFDIIHRNGEEHFDADAVSRILHSGDIEIAREAMDADGDVERGVTMKDIHNLNRLLSLNIAQYNKSKEVEQTRTNEKRIDSEISRQIKEGIAEASSMLLPSALSC
jgi:hypothetical protein